MSNPLLFCKWFFGSSLSLQISSLRPANWWEQLFSCHTWSQRKVTDPYQLRIWPYKYWCICLVASGLWPTSVLKYRKWFCLWEGQDHKIPPVQEKNFYSWPWAYAGFFQALSRPVFKIWNLKGTYEPADLIYSVGNVYNCMSSWTTLHILLALLPLKTPPPTLFKQQTLSNGKHTDRNRWLHLLCLFNL